MTVCWCLFFLYLAPRLIKYIRERSRYAEVFENSMFIMLGFFPSIEFFGATSWYWQIPEFYRETIGLSIYLFVLFVWVKPLLRNTRGLKKEAEI